MANYPGMNPMVMAPPPPPPPPQPMDLDQHVGMVPNMMESYTDDRSKVGHPVEGYPAVPLVPSYVPQPPAGPPPPHVTGVAVPQPTVMGPPMTMPQAGNFHTAEMSKHLIDPYLAAEISSIVHTLSTSQLVYVLAALKKFLKHAPSEARRFLINNPQLTYALLHTQFILGEHDETVLPLSKIDHDISQVNKLERSMHLKPFHNLYEDQTQPSQTEAYSEGYTKAPVYPPQEQVPQPVPAPDIGAYPPNVYQEGQYYPPVHAESKPKPASDEASQADIEELMNQGIYPASAALVDEVLKNTEILTNIQKATKAEMSSWPAEQRQQVLSIKVALHMRGIAVNL